jgi:hypothetical protein
MNINLDHYLLYLKGKYSQRYAKDQLNCTVKYYECLANPAQLLTLSITKRLNALKAMVCLSKYLGCYEEYKVKLKNYGIKWTNADTAFNGFLAIFNHKHDTLPDWVKQVQPFLNDNEKLLLRFLAVTGLRKSEAITSFNMIIELNAKGKLGEYYNEEFSTLEHFKYGRLFLRGTKNAFISVVSKAMITEICNSQSVSYNVIHCRLIRKHIPLRLKELRSYQNSLPKEKWRNQ